MKIHEKKGPRWPLLLLFLALCLFLLGHVDLLSEPPAAAPAWENRTAAGTGNIASARGTPAAFRLKAEYLSQLPELPTGCEAVAAVMALRFAGVETEPLAFVEDYLPLGDAPHWEGEELVGCDPRLAFPGDPRSESGWGCYAPVIRRAMEALLADRDESGLAVHDLCGSSLAELCRDWVGNGVPVLVWGTIGMAEPEEDAVFRIEGTDETFQWLYPLHCLLLIGWDETGYLFHDPLAGENLHYSAADAERSYTALGCQALALSRNQSGSSR